MRSIKLQDFPLKLADKRQKTGESNKQIKLQKKSSNNLMSEVQKNEHLKDFEQIDWVRDMKQCAEILNEILLCQRSIIHYRTRLTQKKREILQQFPETFLNFDNQVDWEQIYQVFKEKFFIFQKEKFLEVFQKATSYHELFYILLETSKQDLELMARQKFQYSHQNATTNVACLSFQTEIKELVGNLINILYDSQRKTKQLKQLIGYNPEIIRELFKTIQVPNQYQKSVINCLDLQLFLEKHNIQAKQHEMMLIFRVFNPDSMTQIQEKDFLSFFLSK